MTKDYLPEGITEQVFIDIVDRVSTNSASKFLFGYHELDDLKQYAMQLAITFLSTGKFKPRGDKPMEVQLTNFLRIWIYNRLSNYRRDNSCRYPNKGGSNQTKYNLMHSLPIYSHGLESSEIFAQDSETPEKLSKEEILKRLTNGFKKGERKLYNRYIDGEDLSEREFRRLSKAVKRILPGEAEEYI